MSSETHATPRLLSRADIRTVSDTSFDTVSCPEWGGSVRVRSLTALEVEQYYTSISVEEGSGKKVRRTVVLEGMRSKLVALAAIDGDGERLFADEDANWLALKSAKAVTRCFEAIQRLSGLAEDEAERLGND